MTSFKDEVLDDGVNCVPVFIGIFKRIVHIEIELDIFGVDQELVEFGFAGERQDFKFDAIDIVKFVEVVYKVGCNGDITVS